MKQILITGGAGFVGYNLAWYHIERGDNVIILDNYFKSKGKRDDDFESLLSHENVSMFEVDLTKPISGIDVPDSLDIVYHLAAINGTKLFYEIPYQVARDNMLIILNLLQWFETKKIGRLLYTSSSEVYAGSEKFNMLKIPTDELAPVMFSQPTDVRFSYATSKFMGEYLCLHFGKATNTPSLVIRYHNIYGPRMGSKHVIPEFALRLGRRENPFNIYGGDETRAFCYIEDAIEATYLLATIPDLDGEVIHVGNSKEEINMNDLALLMMDVFGESFSLKEYGGRSSSVSRRCPDTTKLNKLTGFEAKITLREGAAKTLDWYLKNSKE